jgi:hypothetical protein
MANAIHAALAAFKGVAVVSEKAVWCAVSGKVEICLGKFEVERFPALDSRRGDPLLWPKCV